MVNSRRPGGRRNRDGCRLAARASRRRAFGQEGVGCQHWLPARPAEVPGARASHARLAGHSLRLLPDRRYRDLRVGGRARRPLRQARQVREPRHRPVPGLVRIDAALRLEDRRGLPRNHLPLRGRENLAAAVGRLLDDDVPAHRRLRYGHRRPPGHVGHDRHRPHPNWWKGVWNKGTLRVPGARPGREPGGLLARRRRSGLVHHGLRP